MYLYSLASRSLVCLRHQRRRRKHRAVARHARSNPLIRDSRLHVHVPTHQTFTHHLRSSNTSIHTLPRQPSCVRVRTRTASSTITSTAIIMPPASIASPHGEPHRQLEGAQKMAELQILLLRGAGPKTVEAFAAENRLHHWFGTCRHQQRELETLVQSTIGADPGTVRAVFASIYGDLFLEAEKIVSGIVLHWWLRSYGVKSCPRRLRFEGTFRQLVEYCKERAICPDDIDADLFLYNRNSPIRKRLHPHAMPRRERHVGPSSSSSFPGSCASRFMLTPTRTSTGVAVQW